MNDLDNLVFVIAIALGLIGWAIVDLGLFQ
jgi:hypothetical protein